LENSQLAEKMEMPPHLLDGDINTAAGPIPRIRSELKTIDKLGALRVRLGINRDRYLVKPGLYGIGNPDPKSPVLVTANYKLTFDILRKELSGNDAWVLVLDTMGINVWCAAGKGTFSTDELVNRIRTTELEKIVDHRQLVLPQLSATGVVGFQVKKESGFRVVWGPIRATDIKAFLESGLKTQKEMRQLTFTLAERVVLVPVEISAMIKPVLIAIALLAVLLGIGYAVFDTIDVLFKGVLVLAVLASGTIAGAVVAPILLPWIPGRFFSFKGFATGVIIGSGVAFLLSKQNILEFSAVILMTGALSSYLAMNFTGATPFTSPSGVEKEMRRAIPLQAGGLVIGLIILVSSIFIRV
jgi:hypothetical protein